MRSTLLAPIILAAVASASAHAADINVTPFDNLQAVVNFAADGDRLMLAPGFYNDSIFINGKSLTIEGAGPELTEISARFLNDTVIRIENVGGDGVTLRNLTIADGVTPPGAADAVGYPADGGGVAARNSIVNIEDCAIVGNMSEDDGAGVTLVQCESTILRCDFTGNQADDAAGGLYTHLGTITVTDASFNDNISVTSGGAMYCRSGFAVHGCDFTGNLSESGAAIRFLSATGEVTDSTFTDNLGEDHGAIASASSDLAFTDCDFTANTADASASSGGAIFHDNGSLAINDCRFTRNAAVAIGGAIYIPDGAITVRNARFHGNSAVRGGAFRSSVAADIDHAVFVGNTCTAFGGALYFSGSETQRVRHCTFVDNRGPQSIIGGVSSGASSTMLNCLAWNLDPATADDPVGDGLAVRHSNIQRLDPGDVLPGAGNINAAPEFVRWPDAGPDLTWGTIDDDYGDLRLRTGSGGIDMGDSPAVLDLLVDLDGNPRCTDDPDAPNGGVIAWDECVDMGAWEFQPTPVASNCPGDVTGDDAVNFNDLNVLLENWQQACND